MFLLEVVGRILLFFWAVVKCDAFIFASGRSFIGQLDVRLLRGLRKRTLAVFTGSDARPPYLSGIEWVVSGDPDFQGISDRTRRKATHIRRVERNFDEIISHPAYSQLQRKPYYAFLAVGIPSPDVAPSDASIRQIPVVLHAPTRPLHKGTAEIEATLESLRAKGLKFEYRRLEGLPNSAVLDALRGGDLLIDELYGDTLLGSVGVEAAAAGCAVIVAGYASQVVSTNGMWPLPPVALVDPDALSTEIWTMLSDGSRLAQAKRDVSAFVHSSWAPGMVAERVLAILQGRGDSRWMVDPIKAVYVDGWGVRRDVLGNRLSEYLSRFGTTALHVEHHVELTAALVDRARRSGG